MINLPGHSRFEAPNPSSFVAFLAGLAIVVYLAFWSTIIAAMGLGVWWLWGQVSA